MTAIILITPTHLTRNFSVKSRSSDGTSQMSSGARMRRARGGHSLQVYFTHSSIPRLSSLDLNLTPCMESLTTLGIRSKKEASSSQATNIKTSLRSAVANSVRSVPFTIAITLAGRFGTTTVSTFRYFSVFGRIVRAVILGIRNVQPESSTFSLCFSSLLRASDC